MNEQDQQQLRRLEVDHERLAKALSSKAGKEDGVEIDYANAVRRVVEFRRAHGDVGLMGVRRDKYRIGVSG